METKIIFNIDNQISLQDQFTTDVREGLTAPRKYLKPMYFYDEIGSKLFEQICVQPEYYITRIETELLERYSDVVARMYDSSKELINIIELGSGSSIKTRILLYHFLKKRKIKNVHYFPIDISPSILQETAFNLSYEFSKSLHLNAICSDYLNGTKKADELIVGGLSASKEGHNRTIPILKTRKLIVFLGSSIGNMELEDTKLFLRSIRNKIRKNDLLLVSFDLRKHNEILNTAYNDKSGITAKFNLNLLARINRELSGMFNLGQFQHHAFYNEIENRIEMHLISKSEQHVYVDKLGKTFYFKKGETIHTENSYKYSLKQIQCLAQDTGFELKKNFTDKRKWFDLALFSANS